MKIVLCYLFFATCSLGLFGQNFQPIPEKFYTITQLSSSLILGTLQRQPVVQEPAGLRSQSFQFIPVQGKADVYHIRSMAGMFLNKYTGESWNTWTAIFEAQANGLFSEWQIEGVDPSSVRFRLVENNLYLASDSISNNSHLYVDKSATHPHGSFKLEPSQLERTPVFTLFERNVVIEVEDIQAYPFRFMAEDFAGNIEVHVTGPFAVMQTVFTPQNLSDAGGSVLVEIMNQGAQVGDTGKIVFSHRYLGVSHLLDSIRVTHVPNYTRFNIVHAHSGLVIGRQSNSFYPSLSVNTHEGTQRFLLRKVNPQLNDSLFYIVQDGEYLMLRKVVTSAWNTEYGYSGNEAIWRLTRMPNGTFTFTNLVTQRVLGTDADTPDARLFCDKVYAIGGRMEWYLERVADYDEDIAQLRSVSLSAGVLDRTFEPEITNYHVLVPPDVSEVTVSGTPISSLMSLVGNPAVIQVASPSQSIVGVSANQLHQKAYHFTLKPIVFSQWNAEGSMLANRSVPSQWGWASSTTAHWAPANATTGGTMRFIDNPANYSYNGVSGWTGRVLFLRWDSVVTTQGIMSFPVTLEAGKRYRFSGKYTWHSVVPVGVENALFTFGINTTRDNSGTTVESKSFLNQAADLQNLKDAAFEFTPTHSGVYYLNITSDTPVLAAVADLQIEWLTDHRTITPRSLSVNSSNGVVYVQGTVTGDAIRVYTVQGQLVIQQNAYHNITPLSLGKGVYIIRVNQESIKIIH